MISEGTAEKEGRELAWKLAVELRKEILSSQQVRAQIVGFKITFVGAALGLTLANMDKVPRLVLLVPAFCAIFFDLLVNSYSFSIKRIGYYLRTYLEPLLKKGFCWPADIPFYEEYAGTRAVRQRYSFIGNIGITGVFLIPAIWALLGPFRRVSSSLLMLLLLVFLLYDIRSFLRPWKISTFAEGRGPTVRDE